MSIALIVLCTSLVIATTLTHYESLRMISALIPRFTAPGRLRVLIALQALLVAHVLEIALYGLAYYLLRDKFELGNLMGNFIDSFATYLYFSAETFTSLGFGDIYPTGPMRMVCGLEALNGLLLIGWSVSFTFIYMEHFWRVDEGRASST
jgi:hypothetical protein